MTAYSPAALDAMVKKIAHKAIERVMRDSAWDGTSESGFTSGAWNPGLPPVSGPTGTIELEFLVEAQMGPSSNPAGVPPGAHYKTTRPNQTGQSVEVYEIDPWVDFYEPWISNVNATFDGWNAMPDGGDFDGPLAQMKAAVEALTPLPSKSGLNNEKFDSVDLESNLSVLSHWISVYGSSDPSSLLLFAFDDKYGSARITGVLNNQAQVAIVLGLAILGEKNIWEKAAIDIMTIADSALSAFGYGGDGSINLEVLKAFIGLVKNFVPGAIAKVLSEGSDALSLVEALKPPEKYFAPETPTITGTDANSIYESMDKAVRTLNVTVGNQEWELDASCSGVLSQMQSRPASDFFLGPGKGVDPELTKAKVLNIHPVAIKKLGYQTVPSIAAVMGKAATDADGADKAGIWNRPAQIGAGPDGPYPSWAKAKAQFDAITTGSGKELIEAGAILARGAGFIQDTDGDTQRVLGKVQGELNKGKDSWDNTHVSN